MQNVERWQPSKIVFNRRLQRYVPHPKRVALGSQLAVQAMLPTYVEVIHEHARGRLLDCGCGHVPYYELYRDRVREIVCVDWGNSLHGNLHVDRQVDLNRELPFDAQRFDTVLLADVLEHIRTPSGLLREIARVLAPGGTLITTVPFLYNVHEPPHDYYRFTRYALTDLFANAGFTACTIQAFGGYPDVVLDLLNKGLAPIAPLCHPFVFAAGWLTRRRLYQRWSERTRERYPLGYCCVAHT